MAEIKDVYSIEFDATGFEASVNQAIGQIEELNAATESSADSTKDLEKATNNLTGVLKTNASGIDGLNAKRNVLVRTQRDLNKESAAFTAVGTEIDRTNKKIATSTAKVTTKSRGLFGTFLSGARNLNTVRRSVSLLNGAFRALAGVSVFGLLIQGAQLLASSFGKTTKKAFELNSETKKLDEITTDIGKSFSKETDELNNLFGALNGANEGSQERSEIISEIQNKYGDYIGNINLETASQDELTLAYERATAAILNQVIAQAKANRARELVNQIIDRQIQLQNQLRDSNDAAKQVNAENAEAIASQNRALSELNDQQRSVVSSTAEQKDAFDALNKAFAQGDTDKLKTELKELDETFAEIEKKLQAELVGLIDPTLLTGNFDKAAQNASGSVSILAGSLADLERQLSALKKQQREQTNADAESLANIQKQIDAQQLRVDEAKKILADLQGVARAEANIERLKTELIEDETERRIETIRTRAESEIEAVVGTEKQKAEQISLINEQLRIEIKAIRDKQTADLQAAIDKERENIKRISEQSRDEQLAFAEQTTSRLINTLNRRLFTRLRILEEERNAELNAATNAEQIEQINESFNRRRVQAEKETQSEILQVQIEALEKRIQSFTEFGLQTSEERTELAKLRLELEELNRTEAVVKIDADTDSAKERLKELVNEIVDGVQQISDAVFDALTTQVQAVSESLSEAVDRSRSALDQIRSDSENFNARQLELEKERLEKLEAERARAVEREKALGLAQLTVNSLVAISKAAAEGGAAAPFTIASTLIALLAGFASARTAASNAFFDGSEFVDKEGAFPSGRDTVPARLNRGERVITTETNRKYWDVLSAIHHERIPAEALNDFARGYMQNGTVSGVMPTNSANIILMPNTGTNRGMEQRLERIEGVLMNLPKYMPKTEIKGNLGGILKIVEKRMKYSKFANDRAK